MMWRAAFKTFLSDWPLLAAIGICAVAVVLRTLPLGESLWLDESHTAWCAVGPLDEVALRAAMGNQSPVFYWLEWLLVGVLGESEISLRLPSWAAGSLLPLAVFLLARRWKADGAGLVAAGLVAIDPWSVFYATEARPYAMLQLLAVVHVGLTGEMVARPTRTVRVVWVCVAAALFHLHYTAALFVLAEVVFLVGACVIRRPTADYRWLQLLVDQACLGVLCLPAVVNIRHIFAHRANWAAFIERGPIWNAVDWTPLPGWWWLTLIVIAVAGWLVSRSLQEPRLSQHAVWLAGLWLVVPLLAAWVATTTDVARLFFPRYVVASLPGAAVFAGLCVQLVPWKWGRLVVGIATVGIAGWTCDTVGQIQQFGQVVTGRNEDWRGGVAWLNEKIASDGLPVLVYSGYIEADELAEPHEELLDAYCLSPVNSLYPLEAAPSDLFSLMMHQPANLPQAGEMLCVHRGGAWVVVRGKKEFGEGVAKQICQKLNEAGGQAGWKIDEARSFGRVQVVMIRNR